MTMRERIATGKLFTDYCEGLPDDRAQAKRRMIAFNATGPSKPLTMQEVLAACKQVTKADVRHTFIPTDYLRKNKLSEEFPIWSPPSGDSAYFHKVSISKAIAAGLTFRPLVETLTDTLTWWKTLPPERQAKPRSGLTADKEAAILKAFRESLAKP